MKKVFAISFVLMTLFNIDYTLLRSCRNTITVAGLGGSSQLIAYFELIGTLPASILMTAAVTALQRRTCLHKVFFLTFSFFLLFFAIYTFGLFPQLSSFPLPLVQLLSMAFFVMAELWKVIPLTVLFWGLLNRYVTLAEGKLLYSPLMLGTSLGTMLAGPLVALCTSSLSPSWQNSLSWLTTFLLLSGGAILLLYNYLYKLLSVRDLNKQHPFTFKESLHLTLKQPSLKLLAWIVFADYVAYTLGEVIFLDLLKERYPDPQAYCHYMGHLSFWVGALTALSSLVITPLMLAKTSWKAVVLSTPLIVLLTEGAFFAVLRLHVHQVPLFELAIFLGALQYCLCRAAKYTLFDTSKELFFAHLTKQEGLQGKCVIDGIAARGGKGLASFLTISLTHLWGGIRASAPIAGVIALGMAGSWIWAALRLKLQGEAPSSLLGAAVRSDRGDDRNPGSAPL